MPPPTPPPQAVAPVEVNMRAVFLVGTAAWVLAGGVIGLLLATGAAVEAGWLAVCATGAALGLGGWGWSRRRGW